MIQATDLLDYCGRNNTVFLLIHGDGEKDHTILRNAILESAFVWEDVKDVSAFVPGAPNFESVEPYENLVVITDCALPANIVELWLDYGFLLFSTTKCNNGILLSEEVILNHLKSWARFPFVKAPSPLPEPLRGSDGPDTFTGITMTKRIPQIIHQTAQSIPNLPLNGFNVYSHLADTIRDNGMLDGYTSSDSLLRLLFQVKVRRAIRSGQGWHEITWWLAENYEYLVLNHIQRELHAEHPELPIDPFFYLKEEALTTAMTIFPGLIRPLLQLVKQSNHLTEQVLYGSLLRNLWGNKADLSMSGGKVEKEEVRSEAKNSLLVDNVDEVWRYLCEHPLKKIAIFADNTGLELLCDLALIAIFLHLYPEIQITYVIKADPVFVSDVTLPDMEPTLLALERNDCEEVQWIAQTIRTAILSHRLSYLPSTFLCTASPAWDMPLSMATLLADQDLMIGKGDANYRRLVGDLHWPYETPCERVWNYYPCPLLLLRTLKSNVNVGIRKELQEEAAQSNPTWDCDGKIGIMQFFKPSHRS